MTRFITRAGLAIAFTGLMTLSLGSISNVGAEEAVAGNPSCAALGYEFGYKVEDPSGSYSIDQSGLVAGFTVETVDDVAEPNPDNAVVRFGIDPSSIVESGAVVVKGGPAANVYPFDPAATPMHAPMLGNGKWPTISHVQLCWDEVDEPELGRVEVTKVVAGVDVPDGVVFEICVVPEVGDAMCDTVEGAGVVMFDDLEPGVYGVVETDPGDGFVVSYSSEEVTVVAGGTAAATVTNSVEVDEPELGRVEVTKVVAGVDVPDGVVFEICVVPEVGDAMCDTVEGAGVVMFDDLEPGVYGVVETDPGDGFVVSYSSEEVTVVAGGTAAATVTNSVEVDEPELGRVEVTKVVAGVDVPDGVVFEICVVPEVGDAMCDTVEGAGVVMFDDLEPGVYGVVETDPGDGFVVSYSSEEVTVVAGGTAAATVTNTYEVDEPELGRVEVTKVVAGEGAPTGDAFVICLTPATGDPICDKIEGAGVVMFDGLEPGVYGLSEGNPGDEYVVTYSSEEVTVVAGGTAAATVTNTYEQVASEAPVSEAPTSESPTTTVAVLPAGGSLPKTGTDGRLAVAATVMVLLGGTMMLLGRRPHGRTP